MQEESCSHLLSSRKLESRPNGPQLEGGLLWKGDCVCREKKNDTWNFCGDAKHLLFFSSSFFLTAQWHLLCFMVAVATQRSFHIWLSGQGQHWMKIRLYVINQLNNLIKMDSLCFLFSKAWERERERASNTYTQKEGGGKETIEHSVYLSTQECQHKLQCKFVNVKDNINNMKCAFLLSTCFCVLALPPHPGNLSNPD